MRRAAALLALCLLGPACSYSTRDLLTELPAKAESSTVYAADGTLLHTFHAEENRRLVPLAEISPHLRRAVLAVEDQRFYRHRGVDPRALARALRANVAAGAVEQGGSTITQQYVKNALLRDRSETLARKVEEALLALKLERRYSKDRILELYLNTIYFGNGAYGAQAAARQYFGTSAGELTLAQAALLAGLIRAPSGADPYDEPEAAAARREVVLTQMESLGMASAQEVAAAREAPIELAHPTPPGARRYAAAHFVEEVRRWVLTDPRFGDTPQQRRDLLFGGGLRILTTVDLRLQAAAEAAAVSVLPDGGPAGALVSLEPATGFVRAMVGGRDFFGPGDSARLNLATQAPRQAGSAFKPLVLAHALEAGIDVGSVWPAPASLQLPQPAGAPAWEVSNYGGADGGSVTLAEATVQSYNTAFAQLIMATGAAAAAEAAARYGVRTSLRATPALVLGASEVTALDMASAYATLANRGIRVEPVLVTRITRADGTILYQRRHQQARALSTEVADTITSVLRQVIERGTGRAADIGRPAAGKTGTSQNHADAWFVGYTPELSTAVWVGFTGGATPMEPPTTPIRVTGGSWPARIWQAYMSAAHADRPPQDFATATSPGPPKSSRPAA